MVIIMMMMAVVMFVHRIRRGPMSGCVLHVVVA